MSCAWLDKSNYRIVLLVQGDCSLRAQNFRLPKGYGPFLINRILLGDGYKRVRFCETKSTSAIGYERIEGD
jgi:hypothetical protein